MTITTGRETCTAKARRSRKASERSSREDPRDRSRRRRRFLGARQSGGEARNYEERRAPRKRRAPYDARGDQRRSGTTTATSHAIDRGRGERAMTGDDASEARRGAANDSRGDTWEIPGGHRNRGLS